MEMYCPLVWTQCHRLDFDLEERSLLVEDDERLLSVPDDSQFALDDVERWYCYFLPEK